MRLQIFLILVLQTSVFFDLKAQRSEFWQIDFHNADSIAEFYEDRDLQNPEKLAEDLTKNLITDVEKFRSIFRWISDNIHYDLDLAKEYNLKARALRYKRKKLLAWRQKFQKKMQRKLYANQTTICEGYAGLLERMSNHVGIACEKISGYARTSDQEIGRGNVNHAWNAVRLNNRWYLCDATWASSRLDISTMRFDRRFDKNYFLTEPSLFACNHYPTDTTWTLLYKKPTLKEFLNAPIKHNEFISNQVNSYSPADGIVRIKKGMEVTFEFTSNIDLVYKRREVHIVVTSRLDSKEFMKEVDRNVQGHYSVKHAFENRGNYDVDITINGFKILSYKVRAI
jgi:transglutaminase/protease-like cytokinesis protein 3